LSQGFSTVHVPKIPNDRQRRRGARHNRNRMTITSRSRVLVTPITGFRRNGTVNARLNRNVGRRLVETRFGDDVFCCRQRTALSVDRRNRVTAKDAWVHPRQTPSNDKSVIDVGRPSRRFSRETFTTTRASEYCCRRTDGGGDENRSSPTALHLSHRTTVNHDDNGFLSQYFEFVQFLCIFGNVKMFVRANGRGDDVKPHRWRDWTSACGGVAQPILVLFVFKRVNRVGASANAFRLPRGVSFVTQPKRIWCSSRERRWRWGGNAPRR